MKISFLLTFAMIGIFLLSMLPTTDANVAAFRNLEWNIKKMKVKALRDIVKIVKIVKEITRANQRCEEGCANTQKNI